MAHGFKWATRSAKVFARESGIDWRRRVRDTGGEVVEGEAADLVDRIMALGCVQSLSRANLEHMGGWLYGDVSDTIKDARQTE